MVRPGTFLLLLSLCFPLTAAVTRNLVANPSFESDMDGWRFWRQFPDESTGDIDTDVARFGQASFRVTNPGQGGANLYSANIPCEPGQSYVLSVHVKTQGTAQAGLTAWALAADGETTITHGVDGQVNLPPDEFGVFARFRHIFITPQDCRYVRAHLVCTTGTLWWDAVQLEPGDELTPYDDATTAHRADEQPPPSRNLLPNSSFEHGPARWRLWCQHPHEADGGVRETTGAVGGRAYRVNNTGEGGANFFNEGIPCAPGKTHTLSAWVKTTAARGVKVTGWALDATGETLSYSIGSGVVVPENTDDFVRVSTTFITPERTAKLRAHLLCYGGDVSWDAVQIEAGDTLTDYVDGPSLNTSWPEAERYAQAIVREARLRDVRDQVIRLLHYTGRPTGKGEPLAAAQRALAQACDLLQRDHDVPDYARIEYGELTERLDATEEALASQFALLTGGRRPSFTPWRPELAGNVSKADLARQFLMFPIASFPMEGGEVSWGAIEPLGFRAISRMHAQGAVLPDGTFDMSSMEKYVRLNAAHGYRTVFELPATPSGLIEALKPRLGEDLYFHNSEGEWSPRAHCHNVLNIWHPTLRDALCRYFRAMGRHFRDNPNVLAYELINEPSMQMATPREGGDRHDWDPLGVGGYSRQARQAWTQWLTERYGTIVRLNDSWGTQHHSLAAAEPPPTLDPPPPVDSLTRHPVAPFYDFCLFRAESHTRFFADLLDALHEGDPVHAVMPQFCGLDPDRKEAGLDYLHMACEAPWDVFGTHDWPGTRPAVQSLYAASMNRYANLPHWEDEFIWSQWERKGTPERVMRAATERNLWRQIAYGKRGIILFNLSGEWAHTKPHNWNNSILNLEADGQIPRYSTGIFPVIERKVNAFRDLLFATELTNQGIGLLRPTASSYASHPNHQSRREAAALATWLLAHHWVPLFVPEECILDGREDLTHFRVLVCPYATHVARGLEDRLLRWVAQGGTLICSGPFGLFDQHGVPSGRLLGTVRGIAPLRYDTDSGAWRSPSAQLPATAAGAATSRVFRVPHGQGRIWLSLDCVGVQGRPEEIMAPLEDAFPVHPITCRRTEGIELVLRNTTDGRALLVATNLDPRRPLETTVLLPGRCERVVDLCIDGGAPLPARIDDLSTTIPLFLGPGKGVVFDLGRRTPLARSREPALGERLARERTRRYEGLRHALDAQSPDPVTETRRRMGLLFAAASERSRDLERAEQYLAAVTTKTAPVRPALLVPQAHGPPTVDGDLAEWGETAWTIVSASNPVAGKTDGEGDLQARFAVCRHQSSLFVAVRVRDDTVRNEQAVGKLWQEDCVELFLDLMLDAEDTGGEYGPDDLHIFLGANGTSEIRSRMPHPKMSLAVSRTAEGYDVEAALDLSGLGCRPVPGLVIGFDMAIDDADAGPEREAQITWRGTAANWRDTRRWGALRFE